VLLPLFCACIGTPWSDLYLLLHVLDTNSYKLIITFNNNLKKSMKSKCMSEGPGSSVSIASGYGLDGTGIESRWGAKFSASVQAGPGAHPASCTMGTGPFPGVKSSWGVTLTPYSLLGPWSKKSRAIPLLPLCALRPIQSLSVCTRVHFSLNA
jgi:hypothetical protein